MDFLESKILNNPIQTKSVKDTNDKRELFLPNLVFKKSKKFDSH